jgi:predicted ATPase
VTPGVPYLKELRLLPERVQAFDAHPFSLPFVRGLHLTFDTAVTFLVGENGTGKSTLLEALAQVVGVPASGGSRNELAEATHVAGAQALAHALRASFAERPRDAWFLRAEGMASFVELLNTRREDPDFLGDPYAVYGGRPLDERSQGEAFLTVLANRVNDGLMLLDEPETSLSPQRQLALLALMRRFAEGGRTQFIVATHAPILLTYPDATILSFDVTPPRRIALADTSHYQVTRGVLTDPERWWRQLRRAT